MVSCFRFCQAERNTLRPSSVSQTAPLSCRWQCLPVTIFWLTQDKTNRSAHTGRSSSIRSSARVVLPGRGRCKNPTYGSSPTLCSAAAHSRASSVYAKESTAFMGSSGGRRLRPVNAKSVRYCKIRLSNPSKYRCAASPSNPRSSSNVPHSRIRIKEAASCDEISFSRSTGTR